MGLLTKIFRDEVKNKYKKDPRMYQEAKPGVMYSTGFLGFDFLNGELNLSVDKDTGEEFKYLSVGVLDGSITTFIGRSGCGKSTFAFQAGCNIIGRFDDADLYIDSIEGGMTQTRMEQLSHWSPEKVKDRIVARDTGITAENFFERINLIHNLKLANKEEFEYDTGKVDTLGNPIIKFKPTVYILDSLAMLMDEVYTSENEMTNGMASTGQAKSNTRILKTIVPKLKMANIVLFLINHINQKPDNNPYAKTKPQVAYLKMGETMPGGNAAVYLANNMIRFDDKEIKDEETAEVTLQLVKSRTSSTGRSVTLLFPKKVGFEPDLSLFLMLNKAGVIVNKGAYFGLKDDDFKFFRKDFKKVLYENSEFREKFINASIDYLSKMITNSECNNDDTNFEVTNNILDKIEQIRL